MKYYSENSKDSNKNFYSSYNPKDCQKGSFNYIDEKKVLIQKELLLIKKNY